MTVGRGEFFSKTFKPEFLKCNVAIFGDDLVIGIDKNFGFGVEVAHDDKSGRGTIEHRDIKIATKITQYRQQLPDVSSPPVARHRIGATIVVGFAIRHLDVDGMAIVQCNDGVVVRMFFRIEDVAQKIFKMVHPIEESQINAVGEKGLEIPPRKKIVGFHLKKMGFDPPADRIPLKTKLRINRHRPALGKCQGRSGFYANFEIA